MKDGASRKLFLWVTAVVAVLGTFVVFALLLARQFSQVPIFPAVLSILTLLVYTATLIAVLVYTNETRKMQRAVTSQTTALTQQTEVLTKQVEEMARQTEAIVRQANAVTEQTQEVTAQTAALIRQTAEVTRQAQEVARQTGLSIMPAFVAEQKGQEFLELHNIGNGVATNIEIEPQNVRIGAGSLYEVEGTLEFTRLLRLDPGQKEMVACQARGPFNLRYAERLVIKFNDIEGEIYCQVQERGPFPQDAFELMKRELDWFRPGPVRRAIAEPGDPPSGENSSTERCHV